MTQSGLSLALSSFAALALLVSPAAADIKSYHAAACQNTGNSAAIVRDLRAIRNNGTAGTDGIMVVCPLIRDRLNSTAQIDTVSVEGYNDFLSGSQPYTCTLASQNEDAQGSTLDSHSKTATTSGFVNMFSFVVDTTSGNEGSYSFACWLHTFDEIYHVYVSENGTAD